MSDLDKYVTLPKAQQEALTFLVKKWYPNNISVQKWYQPNYTNANSGTCYICTAYVTVATIDSHAKEHYNMFFEKVHLYIPDVGCTCGEKSRTKYKVRGWLEHVSIVGWPYAFYNGKEWNFVIYPRSYILPTDTLQFSTAYVVKGKNNTELSQFVIEWLTTHNLVCSSPMVTVMKQVADVLIYIHENYILHITALAEILKCIVKARKESKQFFKNGCKIFAIFLEQIANLKNPWYRLMDGRFRNLELDPAYVEEDW